MTLDISAIRQRIEKATPGERIHEYHSVHIDGYYGFSAEDFGENSYNNLALEAHAPADLRALCDEVEELRYLLWIRHDCPGNALYGDDGEMQCGVCLIDFKRDPMERISGVWARQGEAALKKFVDGGGTIHGGSAPSVPADESPKEGR